MPYVLGITVGADRTVAGLSRRYRTGWSEVELVTFETGRAATPTSVSLAADGSVSGGPGEPRVHGFLDRVGDDVPLLVDGWRLRPADLVAELVGWVVDQVAPHEQAPPDRLVLVVPAGWGPYRRGLVEDALWAAGLDEVTLLAEPLTAAEAHAAGVPVPPGTVLAVCAPEACSVVRRTREGTFELLASTELEPAADREAPAPALPATVREAGLAPGDVAEVLVVGEVDPLLGALVVARSPAPHTPAVPGPRAPLDDLPPRPARPPLVVTPLEPPGRRTARHAARPARVAP